jgi:molybdopterin-guanine dinucleotide biosynthesis protein A
MEQAAGFVLAGGRSSRMGVEKALVSFRGEPMIVHALRTLHEAGLPASIAGARTSLEQFAPVVPDVHPDLGPLGGICAALASTEARRAVFLPVDLPLLPDSLLVALLEEAAPVVVVEVDGFAQTFPAVVARPTLPGLLAELEAGRGGCFSAFQAAAASLGQSVRVLSLEDLVKQKRLVHPRGLPQESWFLNLNRPDDLHRAEACLGSL